MSVLEAMSVARPVVATDVGGVRDLVVDGETGVLVTPDGSGRMAEALVALARDRPRAEGLGRAGRLRQQQPLLDRRDAPRLRRAAHRGLAAAGPAPARGRERRGVAAMRPPHVVIVNQNAPLEMDLRPRREAEALAAAGYEVTLVGGCLSRSDVRRDHQLRM